MQMDSGTVNNFADRNVVDADTSPHLRWCERLNSAPWVTYVEKNVESNPLWYKLYEKLCEKTEEREEEDDKKIKKISRKRLLPLFYSTNSVLFFFRRY